MDEFEKAHFRRKGQISADFATADYSALDLD